MATTSMSVTYSPSQKSVNTNTNRINIEQPLTRHLFPYISLIQRSSNLPHFIHHLTFIIVSMQSIGISIWLQHNDDDINMRKYLSLILLFTPIETDGTYIPVIVALSVISLLSAFLFFVPLIVYEIRKRVVKWLLPIQDMLGHVVTPITLIPLFAHFGIGVVKAFELKEGKYYALLVLSAIGCMLNVVSSVLAVTFSANTVYFLNSEYIITNHIIVLTLLIGQGIFATFSYVSVVLGSEIEIAALILHLIFAIVMTVSGIVYTPFLFKWVNYSFGGLAIGSFFGDIFSRFLTTLEYRIVSVVIIWIVSSIIYKFIFDFFAKRLLRDESEKKNQFKDSIFFSL